MFNQTLRNIRSFFIGDKKSVFSEGYKENSLNRQPGKDNDETNIRLMYHRDMNRSIQAMEAKPDLMQHDWWIN